jgi:hypothetical protein
VFGTNIHDLNKALEDLCMPSPDRMPNQVKKHLVEQMVGMPSFHQAVTMSKSENTETQGQTDRVLASITGKVAKCKHNHNAQNQEAQYFT